MEHYEPIRALREDADKTQREIAEVLGVRQSYYSEQERGRKPFQLRQIKALCNYYHVSADYVLGLPKNLSWPRET